MKTNNKHNHSLFIFGLMILLFVAACPLVQAQTSSNDITFFSNRDGNSEIYTMKADGSNQTNLTNSAVSESFPDWSPDGSRIVFVRGSGIWTMNADGSNQIQLTNVDGTDGFPNWSPDGGKIAFARAFDPNFTVDIFVMNADGSNPVKLTSAATGEENFAPRWSPDGSKIVFVSERGATGGDIEIYVMNADGTNQTALTNNTALDNSPDWSPDGSKIAFHTNRDAGNFEIYVMNANGSNQTRITNNPTLDTSPSWSPDGTKFVFGTNRDGNGEIYTINADGNNPVRLTSNTASDSVPRWKPRPTGGAAQGVLFDYFGTGRSDFLMVNFDGQIRWDILSNPALPSAQTRRVYWGISDPAAGIFDNPAFGDYDGDGKNDIGVWRAGNAQNPQSYFYIQLSTNPNPNAILGQAWGLPDDFPYSAGDFDGDGKDDFAVFRDEGTNWAHYILPSGGGNFRKIVFGLRAEGFPNVSGADLTGDGRDEIVFPRVNQATGEVTFFAGDSATGSLVFVQQWGTAVGYELSTYTVGDYIGDGRADLAFIYGRCGGCPNEGTWWIKETGGGGIRVVKFGIALNEDFEGDFPIGDVDFDGDGKLDIAVFRESNSTFYWLRSSDGGFGAQYWDGDSAVPPADSANLFENATGSRGKSIPAAALKNPVIIKQPNGAFKTKHAVDFFLSKK